jgi:hypothetical protein
MNGKEAQAAGIFGAGSKPIDEIKPTTYPSTPSPPGSTVPAHPPATDDDWDYVPNALDGQITLANVVFLDSYRDPNSTAFKLLAQEIEDKIKESLDESGHLDDQIYVKIVSLK